MPANKNLRSEPNFEHWLDFRIATPARGRPGPWGQGAAAGAASCELPWVAEHVDFVRCISFDHNRLVSCGDDGHVLVLHFGRAAHGAAMHDSPTGLAQHATRTRKPGKRADDG